MPLKHLRIIAGPKAKAHIRANGLKAADIAAIPGAAGGPKGLILQGLDHFLFNHWLTNDTLAERVKNGLPALQLIGASIGAWRMAAAASSNPSNALNELANQYCEAQRYPKGVDRDSITETCMRMVENLTAPHLSSMGKPTNKNLVVWVNKGLQPLHKPHPHPTRPPLARKRGFAAAVVANSIGRNTLAHYFERHVMATQPDELGWLTKPFDRIPLQMHALNEGNLQASLLASGSIPFVLNPVQTIPAAQPDQPALEGPFWDGGLTDYHLALPYHRINGLVLYPHFSNTVTPGWLDKFLKTRKANPDWMSNVVLLCPSAEFVNSLPGRKIPDRSDFKRYGENHDLRIQHWREAILRSNALAEEFENWLRAPEF